MKYFIFANNKDLSDTLDIPISADDIAVTMNHCLPLENILQKYTNINTYHFSRRSFNKTIPYSGLHIIDQNRHKFQKIFLYPHPLSIGNKKQKKEILQYIQQNTSFKANDFYHMHGFASNENTIKTRQLLMSNYNKITNFSMGIVAYLYIHQIKQSGDEIYLVGFTHSMNRTKHNADGERDFFLNEKDMGLCQMIPLK